MAKKKPSKKSSSKKGKKASSSAKSKKKYVGKKRGRKPSVPNRYNSIKTAISLNYQETINRKIKRYELKIIYDWIKDVYGKQSARYVLMNIDLIIDNFWQQYCNLYPVDITNHARFFEWYNLKTYLNDEKRHHYPTDIVELDLTAIGQGFFEFFFEDFASKTDEVYEICKSEGIKRESPPPAFYLESANCDITKKGNVFKYKLMMDSDIPLSPLGGVSLSPTPIAPDLNVQPPLAPDVTSKGASKPFEAVSTASDVAQTSQSGVGGSGAILTPQQIEVELQKERIKAEFNLREVKLKELAELLKQGAITFQQYMEALKEI